MISAIKMRSCATYDEIGTELADCAKINFIYGPNGSGKSTVSNYFQRANELAYSNCSVEWEHDRPLEVLVYNRHFKDKNFSGDIDGIFTLGKDIIDDKNKIKELENRRKKRLEECDGKKAMLHSLQEGLNIHTQNFQDSVWNKILTENKADFQEAFTGYRNSKKAFCDEVLRRYKIGHDSPFAREELCNNAKILLKEKPQSFEPLTFNYKETLNELNLIEENVIWSKHIIGNQDVPIAKLITRLDNSDWVRNGLKYTKDNDGVCPFCQQKTITESLKAELEQFFNEEYEKCISELLQLYDRYDECGKELVAMLGEVLSNDAFLSRSGIDVEILKTLVDNVQANISSNKSEIEKKKAEPSRAVRLEQTNIDRIAELIDKGNEKIFSHNEKVANYNAEREKLINDIWTFLLDENDQLILGYFHDCDIEKKRMQKISESIKSFEEEINGINREIEEINKNITSVQPAIDSINNLLKAYGFENFRIAKSPKNENSYQIQRPDGSLANDTLSEGEQTFISFLYFLQLTNGANDISKVSAEKVMIIDAPISSLDSTVLYIVSSLVKNLIKDVKSGKSNIRQIFVFTHNVFFHKETSFIDGRTKRSKDVKYWILRKEESVSKFIAYEGTNPISTSYDLLWRELRESGSLSFISVQNNMRRIIENYFGMIGNKKYDYIKDCFETAEEKQICDALFCWINDGSHSIPDDLYIDSYSDSVNKYKKVFREIFYKSGHQAHYNMMMKIEENDDEREENNAENNSQRTAMLVGSE